jgi:hypothetical protein
VSSRTPAVAIAGRPSAPMIFGARNQTTRSTSPALRNDAARTPPPSRSTRVTPCSASDRAIAPGSKRPSLPLSTANRRTAAGKLRRACNADCAPDTIQVGMSDAVSMSRLRAETRPRPSATTRTGDRRAIPGNRHVRSGSSAKAVSLPMRMASWVERKWCASARAISPVIQRLAPATVAIRPSSVDATLSVNNGR